MCRGYQWVVDAKIVQSSAGPRLGGHSGVTTPLLTPALISSRRRWAFREPRPTRFVKPSIDVKVLDPGRGRLAAERSSNG